MTVKDWTALHLDEVAAIIEKLHDQLETVYDTALNGKNAKVREKAIRLITDTRISAAAALDQFYSPCWPT